MDPDFIFDVLVETLSSVDNLLDSFHLLSNLGYSAKPLYLCFICFRLTSLVRPGVFPSIPGVTRRTRRRTCWPKPPGRAFGERGGPSEAGSYVCVSELRARAKMSSKTADLRRPVGERTSSK